MNYETFEKYWNGYVAFMFVVFNIVIITLFVLLCFEVKERVFPKTKICKVLNK